MRCAVDTKNIHQINVHILPFSIGPAAFQLDSSAAAALHERSVPDKDFAQALENLVSKCTRRSSDGAKCRRAFLYVHQPLIWLHSPGVTGLQIRPWVVDLLYPEEAVQSTEVAAAEGRPLSGPAAVRLGTIPYFTSRPTWSAQLMSFLEHLSSFDAGGKYSFMIIDVI